MSRFIFALFAVLAIFSASMLTEGSCPENQIWNNCASACPRTCENPGPQICTEQCVPRCDCPEGLVRSGSGKCIPASRC